MRKGTNSRLGLFVRSILKEFLINSFEGVFVKIKWAYGTIVICSWSVLSYFINQKYFESNQFCEIILLVCLTSIGVFLSLGTEYFIGKIRLK